jgi:hypothetical protein
MKATLPLCVRTVMKQRAGQVRKLFAGTVATLALQVWGLRRLVRIRTTDNTSGSWV